MSLILVYLAVLYHNYHATTKQPRVESRVKLESSGSLWFVVIFQKPLLFIPPPPLPDDYDYKCIILSQSFSPSDEP